jgi:hypothetical protein
MRTHCNTRVTLHEFTDGPEAEQRGEFDHSLFKGDLGVDSRGFLGFVSHDRDAPHSIIAHWPIYSHGGGGQTVANAWWETRRSAARSRRYIDQIHRHVEGSWQVIFCRRV